jgi:hypothetical protein
MVYSFITVRQNTGNLDPERAYLKKNGKVDVWTQQIHQQQIKIIFYCI